MEKEFVFKELVEFREEDLKGLNVLLLQWSRRNYQMTPEYFRQLTNRSHILAAFDGARLVGTLTLIELHKLSGVKGTVEHVIVDETYRGQGLGKKLMDFAIQRAKELNMESLFLTCEPERIVANRLYQKLGFNLKDTNFYYLDLL